VFTLEFLLNCKAPLYFSIKGRVYDLLYTSLFIYQIKMVFYRQTL